MRRFFPIIHILLLLFFFALQFIFLSKRTQSFNFSDENEHLTPAFMMIKDNKSLYEDLSTNHQPLPIFTSYLFFKFIPIANPFMLIERVRQFVFFFSFIGALVLTLRFGIRGLLASTFIELIKFYFLGYHLLAEAIVIFPLMYITGVMFENVFLQVKLKRSIIINRIDDCIFGISIFYIAFNLLPIWPFLLVFSFFYLKIRLVKNIFFPGILVFFTIPVILLFKEVNTLFWFKETIVNNYLYYMPYETKLSIDSIIPLLIFPFLSIKSLHQPVAIYYALLSLLGLINITLILTKNKLDNVLKHRMVSFYFLLILLNLRIESMDVGFYTAFHLLPQAAFLTMFAVCSIFLANKSLPGFYGRRIYASFVTIFAVAIMIIGTTWWREYAFFDKSNEHFIQYGEEESIGMAISTIKKKDDRLLAGPQNSFVNIFADISLATRQTAYLPWAHRSLELRNQFNLLLEKTPPAFIYFPESDNPYYKDLIPILKEKYTRIQRSFSNNTSLYILSSEIEHRDSVQWKKFSDLLYKPPRFL